MIREHTQFISRRIVAKCCAASLRIERPDQSERSPRKSLTEHRSSRSRRPIRPNKERVESQKRRKVGPIQALGTQCPSDSRVPQMQRCVAVCATASERR
jgi:hypothetical protein